MQHRHPFTLLLALTALLLAVAPGVVSAQVAGSSVSGATVDKVGWWNSQKADVETPATAVTVPAPGVEDDQIAVAAQGATTTAFAAIGIDPDNGKGASVTKFTLAIAEADSGANQGTAADGIVLQACAITDFWVGTSEGDIDTLPGYDCKLGAAAGVRSDDGVWTFDLTIFARQWLDAFGSLQPNGVMLLSNPEAPAIFQAVFDPATITGTLASSPAPTDDNVFATTIPPNTAPPTTRQSSSNIGANSPSIINTPAIDIPVAEAPVDGGPVAVATTVPDEVAAPAVTTPRVSQIGNAAGNFSVFGVIVLVPFLLAMVLATSYWLGPAGAPDTQVRHRGVSRALAAAAATRSTTSENS